MKGRVLLAVVCIAAVSGCATLRSGFAEREVEKAIELINSGDAGKLAGHSGKMFVFDGEILLRSSDIRAVWRHLSENGFSLTDPVVIETFRSDDSTYAIFSESDEMKIFFSEYVPTGSTVGQVETIEGTFYLLLGNGSGGYPAILGITGF